MAAVFAKQALEETRRLVKRILQFGQEMMVYIYTMTLYITLCRIYYASRVKVFMDVQCAREIQDSRKTNMYGIKPLSETDTGVLR